jgi:hypothetical protein
MVMWHEKGALYASVQCFDGLAHSENFQKLKVTGEQSVRMGNRDRRRRGGAWMELELLISE